MSTIEFRIPPKQVWAVPDNDFIFHERAGNYQYPFQESVVATKHKANITKVIESTPQQVFELSSDQPLEKL